MRFFRNDYDISKCICILFVTSIYSFSKILCLHLTSAASGFLYLIKIESYNGTDWVLKGRFGAI